MKRVTLSRVLVLGALMALYVGTTWAANTSAGGYSEGTGGSSPLPIRTDSGAAGPRGHSDDAKTDDIKMRGNTSYTGVGSDKHPAVSTDSGNRKNEMYWSNVKGPSDNSDRRSNSQYENRYGSEKNQSRQQRECKPCPVGMANDCC